MSKKCIISIADFRSRKNSARNAVIFEYSLVSLGYIKTMDSYKYCFTLWIKQDPVYKDIISKYFVVY